MSRKLTIVLVLAFMVSSLATALPTAGAYEGPTVEWSLALETDAYPGEPTAPQAVDLDKDGSSELVLTTSKFVYALRATGTVKWRYVASSTVTGAVAADVNKDGDPEVVAVTESGTVHLLSKDGGHLWSFEAGSSIRAAPAIADLDGNGKPEIILGTTAGTVIALNDQGSVFKKVSVSAPVMLPIVVVPSSIDGATTLLVTTSGSNVHSLDHSLILGWTATVGSATTAPLTVGDIDLDGTLEAVVPTATMLYVISCWNGTIIWKAPLQGPTAAPVLSDLDLDGAPEIFIGDGPTDLLAFRHDGVQSWVSTFSEGVAGITPVKAPDPSLLVVTKKGTVYSTDTEGMKGWHKALNMDVGRSLTASDMDGDTELEIPVVGTGGGVVLLNSHQVIVASWPHPNHDLMNTRSMQSTPAGEVSWLHKWAVDYTPNEPTYTALADIDADGKDEVVSINSLGDLRVTRGNGQPGDTISLTAVVTRSPIAAELNGDGGKEIVLLAGDKVQVRNRYLSQLWNYTLAKPSALAAGDIDGDSRYEVFAGNASGRIVALSALDGVVLWSKDAGTGITSLTVADLGSDGQLELVETTEAGFINVRNCTNGAYLWSSKVFSGALIPSAVGDLDGDGKADLIASSSIGEIVAYAGDGPALWAANLPGANHGIVIMDGNGTGQDIAVVMTDSILILAGEDGSLLDEVSLNTPTTKSAQVVAAYLGTADPVVVGVSDLLTSSSTSFQWTGRNDPALREIGFAEDGAPHKFGDLDGDGLVEMVHGDNSLSCYELNVGPGPTFLWSMAGHDPERTYNPFALGGRIRPDLIVGPEDIAFDPPVINSDGIVDVTLTVHNQGPVPSAPTTVNITSAGALVQYAAMNQIAPFSQAQFKFKWQVDYENSTLDIDADMYGDVDESREANNKASRTLSVNIGPIANAGKDARADPGQPILFDGSASRDPDGDIANYSWDFGDGKTAYGMVVVHSYDNSGTYKPVLTVTDEYGAKGTGNRTILINHAPAFTNWNPKGDPTLNEGERMEFWALTEDADGDKVAVTWYLDGIKIGEGQSASIWANYTSNGTHKIVASASDGSLVSNHTWGLTITNSNRLIDDATPPSPVTIPEGQSQAFEIILSGTAQGASVDWYLDGNKVLSGSRTFGLYATEGTQGGHKLRIEVKDEVELAFDYHEWDVTIGPRKEVPRIRWAFPEGNSVTTTYGAPVYLGISAEGGAIQWYIDDVAQVGRSSPTFRFDTWGNLTYNVTVKVSSTTGTVTQRWTLTVDYPPVAAIEPSALSTKKGRKLTFDGQKSKARIPGQTIATYKWDFGDGTKDDGAVVKHSFRSAGSYNVALTVTDSKGYSAETSVNIVVMPEEQASAPGFEATLVPLAICLAMAVAWIRRRFS